MFSKLFKPKPVNFAAPFSGRLMKIEEVPDPVFSEKMMGDGFAIEIIKGPVVSPVDGKIVALFPTGHAIGIKSDDRNEYLIHLGLDTVRFNGQGFTSHVQVGQEVKKGQILIDVDVDFFTNQGISMICPIIVTNVNQRKIYLLKEGYLSQLEEDFLVIKP